MQPDEQMLEPVRALVRFMAGEADDVAQAFVATGQTILENFPPFLFQGPDAVARWQSGFRTHAADLSGLEASFGPAQDFRREADRVFFSLPTRWTGLHRGAPFTESGGWAFVLELQAGSWRIRSYGWAVTSKA